VRGKQSESGRGSIRPFAAKLLTSEARRSPPTHYYCPKGLIISKGQGALAKGLGGVVNDADKGGAGVLKKMTLRLTIILFGLTCL